MPRTSTSHIVTLFPRIISTTGGENVPVSHILEGICNGFWQNLVESVRTAKTGEGTQGLKKNCPNFTTSGTFSVRKETGLVQHSGLVALDIDLKSNLGLDAVAVKDRLKADPYVYACFISIGGEGLCVLVRIPTENHAASFRSLLRHYQEQYELKLDDLADVSRTRFISYDPAIYVNPDSEVWEVVEPESAKIYAPTSVAAQVVHYGAVNGVTQRDDKAALLLTRGRDIIQRAVDGEKHFKLRDASILLGGGVARGIISDEQAYDALHKAIQRQQNVADLKQAEATIRWGIDEGKKKPLPHDWPNGPAILRANTEFSRDAYLKVKSDAKNLTDWAISREVPAMLAPAQASAEPPVFYAFWEKVQTGRGSGHKVIIDRDKLLRWLTAEGYRAMPDGACVKLFCIINSVVSPIERPALKRHVMTYVNTLPDMLDEDLDRSQIMRAVLAQVRGLFDQELLHMLEPINGEFLRDTVSTSYSFFANCWVATTATGRTAHSYETLPSLIHAAQVKKHNFSVLSDEEAQRTDFHTFTKRVTGGDALRLSQLRRGLGYLLHGYKDLMNTRCVVLMDKIGEVGKSSGGTGKGLLMQAVGEMVEVVTLDGAHFDFHDQFRFEEVTDSARVVFIDEYRPTRTPFSAMFAVISGSLPINRKYQPKRTLSFRDAPKFAIATNEVVTGNDESSARRRVPIALENHYSATSTPRDEFGTGFFEEFWNPTEYNRFFNLMLLYVQDYLANGLLEHHDEDIEARGLAQDVGITFHEFATELQEQALEDQAEGLEVRLWKDETFIQYQQETGDQRTTSIQFSKKMAQFGFVKEKNSANRYGRSRRNRWYFTLPRQDESYH
jgi:hypothetical protein